MTIKKTQVYVRNAHAKINLSLDIVGQREDGYHLLDTVMQSVALADELRFAWQEAKDLVQETVHPRSIQLFTEFEPFQLLLDLDSMLAKRIPNTKSNILHKTIKLWLSYLSENELQEIRIKLRAMGLEQACLSIQLFKRIPFESGLGGASADAAVLLDFLDESFAMNWDEKTRIEMESRIGADVPFTRHKGTVRCGGIGELLSPLTSLPPYPCVIVKPASIGVKTVEAFKRYHQMLEADSLHRPQTAAFVLALKNREVGALQALSGNVFASLVKEEFPALPRWIEFLQEQGSFLCALSGSGTACFALFEKASTAEACIEKLKSIKTLEAVPFEHYYTELAY